MPGHTGGHQASGYGPTGSGRARGPGGGSQIGGKNRAEKKSFAEKLAEARAKNQRQRAQVEANQARARAMNEYNKATGIMTKQGFLRDKFGNLVRSKTQVDRMRQDRQNLLDRAKRNRITNQQLNQLSKLNRNLGFNRTTGMGIIESFRDTFSDPAFRAGLGNLARAYLKISPLGIVMRNILNPQYDQPTGIQSLPDFQGLQRSNMMIGPGVYDFTQPTRMPSNMAGTIPGLSPPTQFADASQSDINTINLMKQSMDLPDIQRYYEGTTVTPEEVEGIYEGTITSPTGQFAII